MLQETALYTTMLSGLQLQPVVAAKILLADAQTQNTPHIIVQIFINVSEFFFYNVCDIYLVLLNKYIVLFFFRHLHYLQIE